MSFEKVDFPVYNNFHYVSKQTSETKMLQEQSLSNFVTPNKFLTESYSGTLGRARNSEVTQNLNKITRHFRRKDWVQPTIL